MQEIKNPAMEAYEALEAEAREINAKVEAAKKAAYDNAVETIKGLMVKFDIQSINLGKDKKTGKGTVAAKYKDPQGDGTWTGRGKQPLWVVSALEKGFTLQEMLIEAPTKTEEAAE